MRNPIPSAHSRWTSVALLVGVALVAAALGCSGNELGATVSGTVTLDGQPLQSGAVVFAPTDGVSNNATAAIQSNGAYSLATNKIDGVKPGKYKASVTMHEHIDVKPGERSMVMPKLLTPEKYADVSTSGLEFDVTSGANTIDIPLLSK